ncbi:MAG: phenylacetic acid degradation-related protein [Myxococcales bacterium]|nr:phenylacetic acid degradation-related protein [Myxococcales bacterium]
MARMTLEQLEKLMDQHFPTWRSFSAITSLGEHDITVKMPFRKDLMRAGGTISGPALMALADTAAYYLTLVHAGPVPSAATANLDIHFLTRPKPGDIIATAKMLRLGRRLAVSTVDLHAGDDLVAHATVTYALPSS